MDTQRTISQLQTILADNTTGAISPQDLRDFLVSTINVLETTLQTLQSDLTVNGVVTADSFSGDGQNITGVTQAHVTNLVSDLAGKASTSHTHAQSDVTGLTAALAGKANTSHTHVIADITDYATPDITTVLASGNIATGNALKMSGADVWISGGCLKFTGDGNGPKIEQGEDAGLSLDPNGHSVTVVGPFNATSIETDDLTVHNSLDMDGNDITNVDTITAGSMFSNSFSGQGNTPVWMPYGGSFSGNMDGNGGTIGNIETLNLNGGINAANWSLDSSGNAEISSLRLREDNKETYLQADELLTGIDGGVKVGMSTNSGSDVGNYISIKDGNGDLQFSVGEAYNDFHLRTHGNHIYLANGAIHLGDGGFAYMDNAINVNGTLSLTDMDIGGVSVSGNSGTVTVSGNINCSAITPTAIVGDGEVAIAPSDRQLIASDGTTVIFDWSGTVNNSAPLSIDGMTVTANSIYVNAAGNSTRIDSHGIFGNLVAYDNTLASDLNSRYLYSDDGTTVVLDWHSASTLYLGGTSGNSTTDVYLQGDVTFFGTNPITDTSAVISINPNSRILYDAGGTPVVDFSGTPDVTGQPRMSFGSNSVNFAPTNVVFPEDALITDGTNTSIDPYNRTLNDSSGNAVIDYNSGITFNTAIVTDEYTATAANTLRTIDSNSGSLTIQNIADFLATLAADLKAKNILE